MTLLRHARDLHAGDVITAFASLPEQLRDPIQATETCWLWRGHVKPTGYGQFYGQPAHRRVYEAIIGPIPAGLHLDHLCEVLVCVNPAHLEPVTHRENMRRRNAKVTHCKQGHEFTPENTYQMPSGSRRCRACNRAAASRYRSTKVGAL